MVCPIVAFESFDMPLKLANTGFFDATVLVGLVMLIGSLIYTIHRAIVYPLLYRLVIFHVYGKEIDPHELEISHWKRTDDPLQIRMKEWGSQTHFMYCSCWGIVIPISIGIYANWVKSIYFMPCILLFIISLISAYVLDYRYTIREAKLFGHEDG